MTLKEQVRSGGLRPIKESLPPIIRQPMRKDAEPLPEHVNAAHIPAEPDSGEEAPKCSLCNDFGSVHPLKDDGKPDWSRLIPCTCQAEQIKEARRLRLLKYCELPEGSENQTLETFRPGNYPSLKEAHHWSKALAEESDNIKWLTLSGGRDLGKSHLAKGVCRRRLESGKPAKYVFVPSLLLWLRESFERQKLGDPGLTLSARMKILCEVPLLVMDDLGTQRPTEWAMEQLMIIINHRYEYNLPLMVTTNKAVDNLPGDDEGRIGSRLIRFVPGHVVVMEAPEYRTRRGK